MSVYLIFRIYIGVLTIIAALLVAVLAFSFYHEVILMDAPCGAIAGNPSNLPRYCDGRLFRGHYQTYWSRP